MLRALVLVLLLANILFGVLVQWGTPGGDDDAQLMSLQMNPQMVRIVGGGQERPPVARPAAAAVAACLVWGPFDETQAARARAALEEAVPAARIEARELPATSQFWVHMPVQRSRAEAVKKLGELKTLGIAGGSVVENDPQWTNAVDLGSFAEEARAREYLGRLQVAGVRAAQITERRSGGGTQWLVREPSEALAARVLEIKQSGFPDSALGATACPSGPNTR